jgi:hypothetical protein
VCVCPTVHTHTLGSCKRRRIHVSEEEDTCTHVCVQQQQQQQQLTCNI